MFSRFLPTLSSFTFLPLFNTAVRRNPCIHHPTTTLTQNVFFATPTYSESPSYFPSKALQRVLFYSATSLLASATIVTTSAASADPPMDKNSDFDKSGQDTPEPITNSTTNISKDNISSFPSDALQFDTYQGITIHVSRLPSYFFEKQRQHQNHHSEEKQKNEDDDENELTLFEQILKRSLLQWKEQKYRGIWLHIPTHLAPILVPYCIQTLDFDFRYAYPGTVILTTWLPDPTIHTNKLPLGPTHQVGVGAVIVHPKEKNKILVVQEKSGPASIHQLWKMPTGLTDPGEDIHQALIREVQEETGIQVDFQQIICFRQAHSTGRSSGGSMGQSDLFFVCLATFSSSHGQEYIDPNHPQHTGNNKTIQSVMNQQHDEIANIQWMDVEEYANQKLWKVSPLYYEMNDAVRRCVYRYHHSLSGAREEEVVEVETKQQQDKEKEMTSFHENEMMDSSQEDGFVDPYGFVAKTLPIGFRPGVNTIYVSKL